MKKKLYSSMLLLFSIFLINNSSLHAQETNVPVEESSVKTVVNVPDENLKKQINKKLGHAETADITQADMESLDELYLEDIENLTGLEYAINLKRLDVSSDKLEDLKPISGLTNLEAISIGSTSDQDKHTKVKDLSPLSGLTNLETITVVNGEVKDLTPISGLTNLKTLVVQDNQIEDLSPISGLNLEYLNIGGNKIESIEPINGMTNLKMLYAWDNNISELGDLSNLSNLYWVSLTDNNLTDITTLGDLTYLNSLYLANNNITDISALGKSDTLFQLGIQNNNVSDISALEGMENFHFLLADGNKILDFSHWPDPDTFPQAKDQRPEVYLKYNNIMDVPKAYKFTVKESNGKSHEFSVDLSGAKKGSNTFTLDYDAGNGYNGTMTVNLEVGDSSTIQINNPYRVQYSADGYLSDEEILEYFGIKAYDKDGNDITDQIKVDSSKVNWNKAGVYDVTLSIVNPDGTVTTKVLQIEIKAGENPNKKLIQTGSTGIGFIVMSLIVALGLFFKRSILVK